MGAEGKTPIYEMVKHKKKNFRDQWVSDDYFR